MVKFLKYFFILFRMETSSTSIFHKYCRYSQESTISRSTYWQRILILLFVGFILNWVILLFFSYFFSVGAKTISAVSFAIVLACMFMSYSGVNALVFGIILSSNFHIQIFCSIGIFIVVSIAYIQFILAKKRTQDFWWSAIFLYISMIIGFIMPGINFLYFVYLWSQKTKTSLN